MSAQILTSFGHELRACLRFRLVKTTIRESGCENCPFFKMDEDNERDNLSDGSVWKLGCSLAVNCVAYVNWYVIHNIGYVTVEKASSAFDKALITNGLERFGKSETEKLHFLGSALLMFLQ
ncbi:hypothetical protein V6N13_131652 [Hibiscus sabdariffa]